MTKHLIARSILAAVLLTGGPVSADIADASAIAEAKAHTKAGSEFLKKERFLEALDEFRKAMALKKTRGAVGNVASTLKLLGRHDEALEMYEDLLRQFKDLPPAFQAKVNAEIDELRAMMGTVVLAGELPVGGALFVDDRLYGKLPLSAPLRLARGIRTIRVEKEGFEPISTSVEVTAGQESRVQLVLPNKSGWLIVREKHNWPLFVEVDGKDVGVAPWKGLVEPGTHRVRLHGFIDSEALETCDMPDANPGEPIVPVQSGTKMESPRAQVQVNFYDRTEIALGAVEMDSSIRVESTPRGAIVMIDYGQVGLTPWEGRLPLGEHVVEVWAEGFQSVKQTAKIERRKELQLGFVLPSVVKKAPKKSFAGSKVLAISGYGLGALGVGLGAVTGWIAYDRLQALEQTCGGKSCSQSEADRLQSATTIAHVSTTGFVVGTVGLVAGTIGIAWLRSSERQRDATSVNGMQVRVGLSSLVLEGNF